MKTPRKSTELFFNRLHKEVVYVQWNKLLPVAVCHRNVLSILKKFHALKATKLAWGDLKIESLKHKKISPKRGIIRERSVAHNSFSYKQSVDESTAKENLQLPILSYSFIANTRSNRRLEFVALGL